MSNKKTTKKTKSVASKGTANKTTILETPSGVKIYPPSNNKYWRITWTEDGKQKDTTRVSQAKAMEKAAELDVSLQSGSGDKPYRNCSEMIAEFVSVKSDPNSGSWGKKHTLNQNQLLDSYVIPVIGNKQCIKLSNEDLKTVIRNADTHSKASHLNTCVSALIHWGSAEGWLPTKKERLLKDLKTIKKAKKPKIAGESRLFVDKKLIPNHAAVAEVAKEAAAVTGIWWYELMFNLAAYSGLRLGELIDLDTSKIKIKEQKIIVNTQCLDVGGVQTRTTPKWNTIRDTTFPKITPSGYELQKMLKKRIKELEALEEIPAVQDETNRLLLFPNKSGGWLNASVFSSRVRRPAQELANWPKDLSGKFIWNFHSLRHVFASYYYADLGKDIRDITYAIGHTSYITTVEMYVGNVKGAIERLRV